MFSWGGSSPVPETVHLGGSGTYGSGLAVDRTYWIAAAVAVALLAVFLLQGYYPGAMETFVDVATPAAAGVAVLTALRTGKRYGPGSGAEFGRAWQLFLFGAVSWLIAEVTWSAYALLLNTPVPYPSLADVFYVAGYAFFGSGLMYYLKTFHQRLDRGDLVLVVGTLAVASFLVGVTLAGPVLLSSAPPLTKAFDLMYPMLDVVLLAGAAFGLSVFRAGRLGRPWLLIVMAMLVDVAADVVFSYMYAQGTYAYGTASDLLYIWAYVILGLAFYQHGKEF